MARQGVDGLGRRIVCRCILARKLDDELAELHEVVLLDHRDVLDLVERQHAEDATRAQAQPISTLVLR